MKDAASQLEFLKEVGSAGVGSLQAPDLLYLQGLLAWKQGQDLSQVLAVSERIDWHVIHCNEHLAPAAKRILQRANIPIS